MKFTIEIATADYVTTKCAVEGGADRIELCAALSDGGTTPSYGTIKKCREDFDVALFPMIRPRAGDFYYTEEEFEVMKTEITLCRDCGCDGVVFGLLTKAGGMDIDRIARLVQLSYPMEVTIHRAFDRCADPFLALEQLIKVGCQRVLTSGQQLTAPLGIALLKDLVAMASERIIIMPGSGVRKENISELHQKTGATEFHSSLRGKRKSNMNFLHPSFAGNEESYSNPFIDPQEVIALRKALQ